MDRWVEISFDCLPLRTIGRLDIPLDASPVYQQRCERIKHALDKHGSHNTYYLYNAQCKFHLTNRADYGTVEFRWQGTVITDPTDLKAQSANLQVELIRETCDWLTAPVVKWFETCVAPAVIVEFDRYIEAGDLQKAKDRIAKLQAQSDEQGGYLGMYL
ncbi:hypothetical protein ETAA8_27850 [Anatilimnocola aggregata]|uniref:Uncharacterized protein n=1 Tax=Anatilimnocola aggregata TaxID=2528021 RepID=A0A517YBR7_9BACT|nr:hypothetical protein [Anatilimnocola aggregata]QDU27696.1 hypothetical protein ETAA8_27850 [Anatilimnocola aggregata]